MIIGTRRCLATAGLACLALAMSACAGSSGSAGGSAGSGSVTLSIWNPEDTPGAEAALAADAKEFEAQHKGVVVNVTTIPWSNIFPKWEAAIQSHTTPDLSLGSVTYATSFNAQGVLEPMNPVVNAIGGNSAWAPQAKTIVEMNQDNGNYFATPWVMNSVVLWYDKPMFAKAHLQPPTTWAQLLQDAKTLTKPGQYGILTPASSDDVTDQTLYSLILANGGDVVDRSNPTKIIFGQQRSVQAIQFYKELSKYSPPGAAGYDRPQAQAAMTTGKLGMFIYGSWMDGPLQQAHVYNQFGVVQVPGNNGGGGSFMGNMDLFMFKGSKHPALARQFAEFMYQDPHYLKWVTSDPGSYLPVTKSAANSSEYTGNPLVKSEKSLVDAAYQGLPKAWVYGMPNVHAGQFEGLNLISQAAADVVVKNQSAGQAAQSVTTQMEKLVK